MTKSCTGKVAGIQPWTSREIATLRACAARGARSLAEDLDRTVASVKAKAHEQGISLRRKGSRRGLVLGQPRGMRLSEVAPADEVRTLVASGRIDMAVVAERMRLDAVGELALCPSCGKRPATNRRTGFCEVCYKRLLSKHLMDELAVWEAQRDQWVAQQLVSRARRWVQSHAE